MGNRGTTVSSRKNNGGLKLIVVLDQYERGNRETFVLCEAYELLVVLLLETVDVDERLKASNFSRGGMCALGKRQLNVTAQMETVVGMLHLLSQQQTDSRSSQVSMLASGVASTERFVQAVTKRLSDAMQARASPEGCPHEQATTAWRNKDDGGVDLGETEERESERKQFSRVCGDCESQFAGGEQDVVCGHNWHPLVTSAEKRREE